MSSHTILNLTSLDSGYDLMSSLSQAEKDIEEVDVAGAAASAPAGDLPPAAAAVMAAYGAVLVKAVDDAALDAHIATLIATEQVTAYLCNPRELVFKAATVRILHHPHWIQFVLAISCT